MLFWFCVIWILFPLIKRVVYWVALAVFFVAIQIWRRLTSPATREEAVVVMSKKKGKDEMVGRRVEYLEDVDRMVRGTILAVHKHLGSRRFFIKWDDSDPRTSFVHEGHPLLTIQP